MMNDIRVLVENDRLLVPKQSYSVPIPQVETGRDFRQYATIERAGRDEVVVGRPDGLEALSRQQEQWQALRGQALRRHHAGLSGQSGGDQPAIRFSHRAARGREGGRGPHRTGRNHAGGRCPRRRYRAAAVFHINNATEQFLEIELPTGAELWTVTVAGEPVKPTEAPDDQAEARRVLIPLVKTVAGDLDYTAVIKYGGKMPAPGWLGAVNFPLVHTKNIGAERSVVQLHLPESYRWFNFGGTMHETGSVADVAAGKLSYETNQAERLMETMRQSNVFATARARTNLKQLASSLQQSQAEAGRVQGGEGQEKLRKELQKATGVLEQARMQMNVSADVVQPNQPSDNRERLGEAYFTQTGGPSRERGARARGQLAILRIRLAQCPAAASRETKRRDQSAMVGKKPAYQGGRSCCHTRGDPGNNEGPDTNKGFDGRGTESCITVRAIARQCSEGRNGPAERKMRLWFKAWAAWLFARVPPMKPTAGRPT